MRSCFYLLGRTYRTLIYNRCLSPSQRRTKFSHVPKFCYQLVYCCLIRHLLVSVRRTKSLTNSSKRHRREAMFENEHVVLDNTSYSHLQRFCANSVSSGLATKVTLTRGGFVISLHDGGPASDFILCPNT
jgi:hypothetical protein